jgi:phosphatidylserine/phosphatidylglycerophosphate/cardiolipin synthase-like enzyme
MIHPNIKLFLPKKSGVLKDLRKLHHKLVVIDEQVVVAGSFNYTEPANDYNEENLFVLGSVFPKVDKIAVDKANCQALARHLKAEIERIIAPSASYSP